MSGDLLGDETRRLLDAATPGPWVVHCEYEDELMVLAPGAYSESEVAPSLVAVPLICEPQGSDDAELIAAAPRLLAGLLAERDAAVARVAELTADRARLLAAIREHRRVQGGDHEENSDADEALWSELPDSDDWAAAPSTPPAVETPAQGVMHFEVLTARWRVGSGEWSWAEEARRLTADHHLHRPLMSKLRKSIAVEGIREPVLLGNDGRVWDGHHRIVIAGMLGIPIPFELAPPATPETGADQ